MPIYEYKCTSCGHTFEVIQKVNDPPVTVCVKCSGPTNKIISSAGLVFKGSGWYITDYSSKGKSGGKSGNESSAGKGSDKGPEKQNDKKNDKKDEKKDATKTTT